MSEEPRVVLHHWTEETPTGLVEFRILEDQEPDMAQWKWPDEPESSWVDTSRFGTACVELARLAERAKEADGNFRHWQGIARERGDLLIKLDERVEELEATMGKADDLLAGALEGVEDLRRDKNRLEAALKEIRGLTRD